MDYEPRKRPFASPVEGGAGAGGVPNLRPADLRPEANLFGLSVRGGRFSMTDPEPSSDGHADRVGRMETIYVVSHHSEHGKRHYPIAAYRREVDAINERRAIDHHTSGGSVVVDKVTLDGAVSQDLETGRSAYSPREKVRREDGGRDD